MEMGKQPEGEAVEDSDSSMVGRQREWSVSSRGGEFSLVVNEC